MKSAAMILAAMILCTAAAWAQTNRKEPHVGYLYPSGARQGTTGQIMAGGQYLRNVTGAHVTGEGVRVSLVRYMGRVRQLSRDERMELRRRIDELKESRQDATVKKRGNRLPPGSPDRKAGQGKKDGKKEAATAERTKLPKHPLFDDLEELGPWELEFLENEFFRRDPREQPNSQIGETVLLEVTIDHGAEPGDRELRLETSAGMTNPMCFQVGYLPEIREQEPYDVTAPKVPPVDLPILLNGQIRPGDVDRFRFRAEQGQKVVIMTHARHLIPFLADAVPGWFQATLAVYDSEGREVAYADDYQFDPDPVLWGIIPETGLYELEVRDSIYRGRDDFVYRISVGELPFIRSIFPLGGRAGSETSTAIEGWNLDSGRMPLDTRPGAGAIRQAALDSGGSFTNSVVYAVDDLPECLESEPNDLPESAQEVELPVIVNGRIDKPGDADIFRFRGKRGAEIACEVNGRRLHSPIDSLLQLTDAEGKVVAWNDDHEFKEGFLHRDMGGLTHHADSYLRTSLPRSGMYCVRISDSQRQGGPAHGYRLRIGPPQPDFSIYVTPSSIVVPAGLAVPVRVHVVRRDGFDGDVEIALVEPPPGFALEGGRIPAGRDSVRMTLSASREAGKEPVSLNLEGIARTGDRTIRRPAAPSENVMQAFLYRHLLPSRELVATVSGKYRPPQVGIPGPTPVRIPAGGTVKVRIDAPHRGKLDQFRLSLSEPPEGVTIEDVAVVRGGMSFVLIADGEAAPVGLEDNLIVEVSVVRKPRAKDGKKAQKEQRFPIGVLPAIPFEIVRR